MWTLEFSEVIVALKVYGKYQIKFNVVIYSGNPFLLWAYPVEAGFVS